MQLTLENSATSRLLRTQESITQRLSKEAIENLNETEIIAIQYVYARSRITPKELAAYIGRTPKTCSGVLKRLSARGILSWHGTSLNDPTQYYDLGISE